MRRFGFPIKTVTDTIASATEPLLLSGFVRKLTRTPGKGVNTHRSNRAKEGYNLIKIFF